MNEQAFQAIIVELGNTISQLQIDLAIERTNVKILSSELNKLKEDMPVQNSEDIAQ